MAFQQRAVDPEMSEAVYNPGTIVLSNNAEYLDFNSQFRKSTRRNGRAPTDLATILPRKRFLTKFR